ncbi:HlyD family efflux transporter periplasmic adaptor subunit [Azospirillum sp. A1-3]|uniref:efflux RND transporter periplasmic adaptor subunit n=1 Tax=Azospirillum sp. A1-3 TaxID=185874 RepID=UPI002076DA9B|nr:HlyD family efflux transporter periplasmic adaptor subunit [Azospirillum sp. A1-3]MCM8738752.1 HlyD family efflux transporter periplasmic adaptor subunit [Azospirillum sp. A1-3]
MSATTMSAPPAPLPANPAAVNGQLNRQLLRVSAMLQVQKRARHAGKSELPFVMVNETASVLPYQQAALWQGGPTGSLVALSGVSVPDLTGAYASWVTRLLAHLAGAATAGPIEGATLPPDLRSGWSEHLSANAFWLPLAWAGRGTLGGLLLARTEPWSDADAHLLDHIGDAYAHAWLAAHARKARLPGHGGTRKLWAAATAVALLLGVGAIPVRQSVLAPAEVIPRTPTLVRAPFEGVVDSVAVKPNQAVAIGQPLVTLDTAQLLAKHKVALKARDVTQAEYQQAAQQAVFDAKAKAQLVVLQGKLEQEATEAAYLQTLLERATLSAPMAGVAVFDDVNDWVGRPVAQGERIMMLADPHEVELEISLPVGDALPFQEGADVTFFLNVTPDAPVHATLVSTSYRAQAAPDGVVAYRLKAHWTEPTDHLRIGLKGTAKIYGDTAPLALWVLRRPIASVRQWLTL